ncbi:MAG TPA: KTSC domain-containing protein, partial [Thermodesulfobacteriota bacterium]|nr:KTSC domain-containing protein [Thermodesulfobacteriota bacterium]
VQSKNIKSVGYNKNKEVLEIEFHHGGVYNYSGVQEEVFNDLMKAPSIGKFFHSNIRSSYRFKKGEVKSTKCPNIYLCGKAGAGKSITAEYILKKKGFSTGKFAYPVYDIARNYFGMTNKDRQLLIDIGTKAGRALDKDLWIIRFVQDLEIVRRVRELRGMEPVSYIIDDCRFQNEHRILKDNGWVGIYLDTPFEIRRERLIKRDGSAQEDALDDITEKDVDNFKDELIQVDSSGDDRQITFDQIDKILEELSGE